MTVECKSVNFFCYQHSTQIKPQKPGFLDNLKKYRMTAIPKSLAETKTWFQEQNTKEPSDFYMLMTKETVFWLKWRCDLW